MRKFCFAIAATLVVLGSAEPVPAAGSTQVANAERPEHLVPASSAHVASRLAPQMPSDTALARLASTRLRTQTAAAASTAAASVAAPFLTRPYIGYHVITSVFDHCNPDYTTDGSVCRFDGTVGLRGYGVDPSFSRGYAQTPGGGDYLYYDGHNGWDYGLSYENVRAAGDGVVSLAGADSINPCFGQTIIVNHPNGFSTRYAHLSSIYVGAGQSVSRGQVIAGSGNTGCSSGPHLHFGVYVTSSWTAIDPWGWWGAAGGDPWSADSGNLWLTGSGQYPIPWAPTGVTATPADSAAVVSWTTPGFDGGTPIASYTVTASPGGATISAPGTQTSAVMTGLTNGSQYTFTVTAIDAIGSGPASSASASVTPNGVPAPPTNVVGIPGAGSARVSWTPSFAGASPITGYTVTGSPGNLSVDAGLATSLDFPGLTNGTTYRFMVTAKNAVGTSSPSQPSNSVTPFTASSWQPLTGVLSSSPAVVSTASGRLDVFIRGSDQRLWHRSFDAGGWTSWESLGGVLDSDPTAAAPGSGRIDVFVRGTDKQLWHLPFDGTTWGNWEPLGGVLGSGPAVSSWGNGRMDIFVRGTDGAVWHRAYDGGWGVWDRLGGVVTADPAAVSWGPGRLDVVIRGSDSALWHKAWTGSHWTNWESLGGVLPAGSGPGISSWGPGRLDVFVRSTNDNLWHDWFDGTSWSGLKRDDPNPFSADPAVVSWGQGRIDVFVRGTDSGLWHKSYD